MIKLPLNLRALKDKDNLTKPWREVTLTTNTEEGSLLPGTVRREIESAFSRYRMMQHKTKQEVTWSEVRLVT